MATRPFPARCPRCTAMMFAESDSYGAFASCTSCGHVHEPRQISEAALVAEEQVAASKLRRRHPSTGGQRL